MLDESKHWWTRSLAVRVCIKRNDTLEISGGINRWLDNDDASEPGKGKSKSRRDCVMEEGEELMFCSKHETSLGGR